MGVYGCIFSSYPMKTNNTHDISDKTAIYNVMSRQVCKHLNLDLLSLQELTKRMFLYSICLTSV